MSGGCGDLREMTDCGDVARGMNMAKPGRSCAPCLYPLVCRALHRVSSPTVRSKGPSARLRPAGISRRLVFLILRRNVCALKDRIGLFRRKGPIQVQELRKQRNSRSDNVVRPNQHKVDRGAMTMLKMHFVTCAARPSRRSLSENPKFDTNFGPISFYKKSLRKVFDLAQCIQPFDQA